MLGFFWQKCKKKKCLKKAACRVSMLTSGEGWHLLILSLRFLFFSFYAPFTSLKPELTFHCDWLAGPPRCFFQFHFQIKTKCLKTMADSDQKSLLVPDTCSVLEANLWTPTLNSNPWFPVLPAVSGQCWALEGCHVIGWNIFNRRWQHSDFVSHGSFMLVWHCAKLPVGIGQEVQEPDPRFLIPVCGHFVDPPAFQPASSRRLLRRAIIWPKPKHKTPWVDGFSVTFPGYWECNKNNTPSSSCPHLVAERDSERRLKQALMVLRDLRRRLAPPDGSDLRSDWASTGRSRSQCTAAQPVGRLAHGLFSLSAANNPPPKFRNPAGRSTKGNEGKTPEIPNHQNSAGIYSNYHPTRLHAIHLQETVRISAASR